MQSRVIRALYRNSRGKTTILGSFNTAFTSDFTRQAKRGKIERSVAPIPEPPK